MASVRASLVVATLGTAVTLSCATARVPSAQLDLPLQAEVQGPGLLFDLQYTAADEPQVRRISEALLSAGPPLSRWGSFRQGVSVRVFPDHEALEDAVQRRGYPWLRAWAFGEQILLQSPRSWGRDDNDEELHELLVHELTHALMYQLIAPAGPDWTADAPLEEPPLWFREGMASVTAGQGSRRLSSNELWRWQDAHPGADLLHPSTELYRTEKEAVYGAAHRAFDLLVATCGDQCVRDVLRALRDGARFADAFKAATGRALADFEGDAVRTHFAAKPAAPSPPSTGTITSTATRTRP